jgi:hypothetical protein
MARSIFLSASAEGSLAEVRSKLAAELCSEKNADIATFGLQSGLLVLPEGKAHRDLAEALRKATPKAKAAPVPAAEPVLPLEAPTVPVPEATPEPVTADAAPVVRVNGKWVCQCCNQVARKRRMLPHQRTCVNRQTPVLQS